MNVKNAFIVYLMPATCDYSDCVAWLKSFDSFSLADQVLLVRGIAYENLTASLESQLPQTGAYFVCALADLPAIGGATSAQSKFFEWLYRKP